MFLFLFLTTMTSSRSLVSILVPVLVPALALALMLGLVMRNGTEIGRGTMIIIDIETIIDVIRFLSQAFLSRW
jgi:hypothetical protein